MLKAHTPGQVIVEKYVTVQETLTKEFLLGSVSSEEGNLVISFMNTRRRSYRRQSRENVSKVRQDSVKTGALLEWVAGLWAESNTIWAHYWFKNRLQVNQGNFHKTIWKHIATIREKIMFFLWYLTLMITQTLQSDWIFNL